MFIMNPLMIEHFKSLLICKVRKNIVLIVNRCILSIKKKVLKSKNDY